MNGAVGEQGSMLRDVETTVVELGLAGRTGYWKCHTGRRLWNTRHRRAFVLGGGGNKTHLQLHGLFMCICI